MRRFLAVLFTAAPFVAGAVAALSARRDVRMLCMAAATTLVARVAFAVVPARRGITSGAGAALVAMALAAATFAAAAVAVLFGARAVFGVGAVAVVLAGCATAGAALGRRPRTAA